jgi:hypothetical protein
MCAARPETVKSVTYTRHQVKAYSTIEHLKETQ